MSESSLSLAEALPLEIHRVQDMIPEYESVPFGSIAAQLMKTDIEKAHKAMMEQDVVAMIEVYNDLKGYKY